ARGGCVAIAELAGLAEDFDQLVLLELPEDLLDQRRRKPQLIGGPFGAQVRDGAGELERQVVDDPGIQSRLLDGARRLRRPAVGKYSVPAPECTSAAVPVNKPVPLNSAVCVLLCAWKN